MAWGETLGGAAQGAAAGFAVGGPVGAGIGGVVGFISGLFSSSEKDSAQRQALDVQREQLAEQRRMYQEQLAESRQIRAESMQYARATPEELSNIRTMLTQAKNTLDQQMSQLRIDQDMLNSVDPSIKAMGEETLKLLRGEESRVLAPLRRQRDTQREELKARLREQLGPGFETTSAGMRALSSFDTQTSDLLQTTQQNTISSMMGLTSQALATRPDISGRIGNAGQLYSGSVANALQGQQNIQNRMVNASSGTRPDYSGQNNYLQSMQNYAQNVGNMGIQNAQSNANAISGIAQTAGTFGAMQRAEGYQDKMLSLIEKNKPTTQTASLPTLGGTTTTMPNYSSGANIDFTQFGRF